MKPFRWYTPADAPSGVPMIDLAALQADEKQLGRLRRALFGSGIFYLTGFGMDSQLFQRFNEVTQSFFETPESAKEKMICKALPLRGYSPLKSENLAENLSVGNYPDLCMKYSWNSTKNIYPNERFREVWEAYYEKIGEISKTLLSLIAKLVPTSYCNGTDWELIINGDNNLRHLFYPDLNEAQQLAMAPHSDLGSLSLVYQTPAPNSHIALEAEIDGKFVPIPAIENTLVVNFGDVLSHITENKIVATRHRIVHSQRPNGMRTSTICFCLPQRKFNLRKFSGGKFCGLLSDEIQTFGELLDKNGRSYLKKE